uniref:Uncharacterized protein n=1 Tax=Caudovirales sp. ct2A51 TaxID=2827630 RepID=A0A8S5T0A2_9CAUD|nr:MAG TPA: hypothetical protein [Caudoviricetes sp.]DAF56375.1 MAG TPA: hypothetical protein [Caudovirales sp. ct2A51]DAL44621.1 MAG TPA_asm: hypothetical protein [Caudoviricetes sp.]
MRVENLDRRRKRSVLFPGLQAKGVRQTVG